MADQLTGTNVNGNAFRDVNARKPERNQPRFWVREGYIARAGRNGVFVESGSVALDAKIDNIGARGRLSGGWDWCA